MNVNQIYQLQRDDSFARQFLAEKYQTFVAMPFSNRGGYPEPRIRKMLLELVHESANALLKNSTNGRTFAPLRRVDGPPGGAIVITDQIVTDILDCHFFLGDMTGCNFGVVFEAGIALALKPNRRVLLFSQDDPASLHFDLRATKVNGYDESDLVAKAASALAGAAEEFEKEADRYIRFLSGQLTPDGISLLNIYGQIWKGWRTGMNQPSIWEDVAAQRNPRRFRGPVGRVAFHNGVRELAERRLFWTHYSPNVAEGIDRYGIHATELGWRLIEHLWKHDPEMREPTGSVTGPNLD